MLESLQPYKPAIFFILKFIGLYFLLNTVYGFYVTYYYPGCDPLTSSVTNQSTNLLSIFHDDLKAIESPNVSSIAVEMKEKSVINVYEGCNSVSVIIVYLSFIVAFTGNLKRTLIFIGVGAVIIYIMNLARIVLLFEVSNYFPDQLYFFHKFLFTGIIYLVVFVMWFIWIRKFKRA